LLKYFPVSMAISLSFLLESIQQYNRTGSKRQAILFLIIKP